jgi:hypothetical protein
MAFFRRRRSFRRRPVGRRRRFPSTRRRRISRFPRGRFGRIGSRM